MDQSYPSIPLQRTAPVRSLDGTRESGQGKNQTGHFSDYFKQALSGQSEPATLKISKHAGERLQERGIELDDSTWKQISEKVAEAKQKGLDETLVLADDAALIVSAKNATVITAMDRSEAGSQIFSNINGAIILESPAGPEGRPQLPNDRRS
ncbi:MAG: flagellar operon protein [Weizmannia coagulans]|jgi:flagellar operon protein|uniref:TIGR02530 family flagellar biosynthesis protein n=1 Tax=Heyndrickxia TaxID=2837504 RepID=UPI0027F2A5C8|nr:TIGR02530 family flagellar biosynthesis protein [Weizmannia sp. CD-2023]MCI1575920.1 flagellar operon protein [Heyndrickxia coagulans]MED4839632.1 TIGR02530 family flagellar biosynthesis protein [Weizmannia sp. CD-2023]MED4902045.1 TIGR02530 family flagellar biosynthesis protein [Weizmannia sp. CD-2023]